MLQSREVSSSSSTSSFVPSTLSFTFYSDSFCCSFGSESPFFLASTGVVGARAGTLSFMVGSDSNQSFAQAEPYLLKMGSRAIHCGKNSNGLIAKICNNMLLGISMLGVSEAMLMGTAHGLSPQLLAHIINTS